MVQTKVLKEICDKVDIWVDSKELSIATDLFKEGVKTMIASIAESINIMSKTIGPAMKERNAKPIQEMAVAEAEAGSTFLDVNIGPARKGGAEMMEWLVKTIHEVVDMPLSLIPLTLKQWKPD